MKAIGGGKSARCLKSPAYGASLGAASDWVLTPDPSLFDALANLVERLEVPGLQSAKGLSRKQIAATVLQLFAA
jgi:hypothetical protein